MENFKDIVKKLLILLAVRVLKKHKPSIIAIIGSVGKTTARNAIYTALSRKYSVRKSEQSLTTDIGVPLTLLGCPYSIYTFEGIVNNIYNALWQAFFAKEYPEYVILEIDGHSKGEIGRLAEWISIDLLVVTTIGEIPAHVEYFDTPDNLRREYALILGALKETAKVVAYADDEYAHALGAASGKPMISYGSVKDADICAKKYKITYEHGVLSGISFGLEKPSLEEPIVIHDTVGIHVVNGVLAGMAVLQALGEHPLSMNSAFEKMPFAPGRMRILPGIKGSVIIDDSYNSSPVAVEELLKVIHRVKVSEKQERIPKKIIVLGDMLELGRFSSLVHQEIGRQIGKMSEEISLLVCVGMRSRFIANSAQEAGMSRDAIFHFDLPQKAGEFLQNMLEEGDVAVIKGSQNMRMERCVEEIMTEPEKKERLLVRQSEEWLGR